jgi:hypothetical protein
MAKAWMCRASHTFNASCLPFQVQVGTLWLHLQLSTMTGQATLAKLGLMQ